MAGDKNGTVGERTRYAAVMFLRDGIASGAFTAVLMLAVASARAAGLIGEAVPAPDTNVIVAGASLPLFAVAAWRVVRPVAGRVLAAFLDGMASGQSVSSAASGALTPEDLAELARLVAESLAAGQTVTLRPYPTYPTTGTATAPDQSYDPVSGAFLVREPVPAPTAEAAFNLDASIYRAVVRALNDTGIIMGDGDLDPPPDASADLDRALTVQVDPNASIETEA